MRTAMTLASPCCHPLHVQSSPDCVRVNLLEAIAYLKERKNKRNQKQYYRAPKKTVHKLTDWSKYEKQNQTKKRRLSTEERNKIFREFGKNE